MSRIVGEKAEAAGGVLHGTFPVAGNWLCLAFVCLAYRPQLCLDAGYVCQETNDRTKGSHSSREGPPQMQGSLSSRHIPFFLTNLNPQIFQLWITNWWQVFWLSAQCLVFSVIVARLGGIHSFSSPYPTPTLLLFLPPLLFSAAYSAHSTSVLSLPRSERAVLEQPGSLRTLPIENLVLVGSPSFGSSDSVDKETQCIPGEINSRLTGAEEIARES